MEPQAHELGPVLTSGTLCAVLLFEDSLNPTRLYGRIHNSPDQQPRSREQLWRTAGSRQNQEYRIAHL